MPKASRDTSPRTLGKNMNSNSALSRLQQAEGTFPCDPSARIWRLLFIFAGWILIPAGVVVTMATEYKQFNGITEILCAVALLMGGLLWGYMAWLQKNHRYEIRNGIISSVGRKVLWSLNLADVQAIKEYRSGSFAIWWLHATSKTKGIVLCRSLRNYLELKT
jgi:hypothetical protein